MTVRKQKICCIIGTRPECIKVAPVARALQKNENFECIVVSTGQHTDILEHTFSDLKFSPDVKLKTMVPGQSLSSLTGRLFEQLGSALEEIKPDMILVQGDTTSSMVGAMIGFYQKIPVGHIEAGLRSYNLNSPFPEEMNRQLIGILASVHFAPTPKALENLKAEGKNSDDLMETGNTGIDTLLSTALDARKVGVSLPGNVSLFLASYPRFCLITAHRRENFGVGIRSICAGIRSAARRVPEVGFLMCVHPNPNVQGVVEDLLKGCENITLIPPVDYSQFVHLMDLSSIIVTDSGGVQEEAPSLVKPILVTRNETERPEGIEAGCAKLVGTDQDLIEKSIVELLTNQEFYQSMAASKNPYGDGQASSRIARFLSEYLNDE
ncbi:non-hydrolyzing UDP-N-acetylglucosamine 2-epimerase [Pseudovibrio sp. SPO723]|uniref:non-hydrolyzing UDP-N-acetylglucosamine 2-epimerase n=1 Tax=Nesiotobacter zosterae TaxID=392721 RepID=UPI0029C58DF1|nr:UDP-N-acetylglucosamine 2-epimerase (non-hydrolyzing) [Pseudovibrio sp. SPO723]MDX5593399.1 UDP-N-acetylglucosamine 2-epimerase (non-hydrolyzing) [Pseudovibrio sp. SPO723]